MKWIINYNKLAVHTYTVAEYTTLTLHPVNTRINAHNTHNTHNTHWTDICWVQDCYSNKVINIIERKTNNFMIRSSRNKAIKMCNILFLSVWVRELCAGRRRKSWSIAAKKKCIEWKEEQKKSTTAIKKMRRAEMVWRFFCCTDAYAWWAVHLFLLLCELLRTRSTA